MYEQFGATFDPATREAQFRLFVPDNAIDPSQYAGDRPTHFRAVRVAGTFQPRIGQTAWDFANGPPLTRRAHANGWLYESAAIAGLPDDFYEYKYQLTYDDGATRVITDPCNRYGGSGDENAGLVVGPVKIPNVTPHPGRAWYGDLVEYELMIDDFAHDLLQIPANAGRAPLDVVRDRLDELVALGVSAIEFMPWTAWPGDAFSWGYR